MLAMEPRILTPGVIAEILGVPLHLVQYRLADRERYQPFGRAGRLRVYRDDVVAPLASDIGVVCPPEYLGQGASQ